jgi:hypothetical protein
MLASSLCASLGFATGGWRRIFQLRGRTETLEDEDFQSVIRVVAIQIWDKRVKDGIPIEVYRNRQCLVPSLPPPEPFLSAMKGVLRVSCYAR